MSNKNPLEALELLKLLKLIRLGEPNSGGPVNWLMVPMIFIPILIVVALFGFRKGMVISESDLRIETKWYKWILRTRRISLSSITNIGPMKYVDNPPWYIELVGSKDRVWLPHDSREEDLDEMDTIKKIQGYFDKKRLTLAE